MKKLVALLSFYVCSSLLTFGQTINYSPDMSKSVMKIAEIVYQPGSNRFTFNDDVKLVTPNIEKIEVYGLCGKSAFCIGYPKVNNSKANPNYRKQYALYQLYNIDKTFKGYIKNSLAIKPMSENESNAKNQQMKANLLLRAKYLNDSLKHVEDSIKYINSEEYKDSIAIETMKNTYCETHTINKLDDYFVKDITGGRSFYLRIMSCIAYNDSCFYMLDENGYLRIFNIGLANDKMMKSSFDCHINCFGDSLQNYYNAHPELGDMIKYNQKVREDKKEKEEKELAELQTSILKDHPYIMMTDYGFILNVADGVEPYFEALVTGTKEVKYIHYYFKLFNPVGDLCSVKYQDSNICQVTVVGPIEPFGSAYCKWDKATHYIYDSTADTMKIVKIKLDYMDGTTRTITTGF